ncbi:Hint domain-containing protein [Falsirhodobacter algicola]|uniref:Hedgehog/Intein (Hint) domain-containing protein n=1 Tax=Falsirhodobacter algicola TaxID=2692330 RepID=A0A8J8MR76_9RHOB|nr:Hint domain-containing protein [Falsirhodobacter algicola]QUS34972.1 hypothetical protein GR316_00995 [Falsirhodobacter algicola]
MALLNLNLGGSGTTRIDSSNADDTNTLSVSALGSHTLIVDGVNVTVSSLLGVSGGARPTFSAINGGSITINSGLTGLNALSSMSFNVSDDSSITYNAPTISALGGLSSYSVTYSGDGAGDFTFNPGTATLLSTVNVSVTGMSGGDDFNLNAIRLDPNLSGASYRNGILYLEGNSSISLLSNVEVAIPMTSAEYAWFVENQATFLTTGQFTFPSVVYLTEADDSYTGTDEADLIYGGATSTTGGGNDTIFAGGGADDVYGGVGNDVIYGGAGADSLVGGAGNDTLGGGEGNDTLIGGAGVDVVDYSDANAAINFTVGTTTFTAGTNLGTDSLSGIEGVIGSAFGDTLTGSSGDNILYGGAGNDTLDGLAGSDTLFGGAGDDVITVRAGDTASGDAGDDTINVVVGANDVGTITIAGGADGNDQLNLNGLGGKSQLTLEDGVYSGSIVLDRGAAGTLTINVSGIENVFCFTPGAMICTADGPRAIETLAEGDLVLTRDSGLQPIRWIGRTTVPGTGRFAPIRIRPGAVPELTQDLVVSPQHRMLIEGYRAELLFGENEVLATAQHMVDGKFVTVEETETVTYIHMTFDRHEIVYANDAATESYYPGNYSVETMDCATRDELLTIFPELRAVPGAYGCTARRVLRSFETAALVD